MSEEAARRKTRRRRSSGGESKANDEFGIKVRKSVSDAGFGCIQQPGESVQIRESTAVVFFFCLFGVFDFNFSSREVVNSTRHDVLKS